MRDLKLLTATLSLASVLGLSNHTTAQTKQPPPTTPTVKSSSIEITTPTKAQIIDSIRKNDAIPESVRNELADKLATGETLSAPTIDTTPTKPVKFDNLLSPIAHHTDNTFNLVNTNTPPAVKAADDIAGNDLPSTAAKKVNIQPPTPAEDKFETPKIEIGGADRSYQIGDAVQLWVKPITKKPESLYSISYSWNILPVREFTTWPDTTRIVFGTGPVPKTYTIILNASYVFVVMDGDKVKEIAQRTSTTIIPLKVGDGGNGPTPPDPNVPNNPPNLTGLSKTAYGWVAQVTRTPTYTNEMIKTDARRFAASFRDISKKIDQKLYISIEDMLAATQASNNAIVIDHRNEWLPWFKLLSDYLQQSYNNSTIRTLQHYNQAWNDIATGLDAIN